MIEFALLSVKPIFNRFDWRSMTAATIEIHFYYIKTYLKGLKGNRFQSFWCLFGVY